MLQWFCESSLGSGMYQQRGDRWIEKPANLTPLPSMQYDTERKLWVDVTVKPNTSALLAFALTEHIAKREGKRGGSVHQTAGAAIRQMPLHVSLTAPTRTGAGSVSIKLAPGAATGGNKLEGQRMLVVNRGGATEEGTTIVSVSNAVSGAITLMVTPSLTFSHAVGEPAVQLSPAEA